MLEDVVESVSIKTSGAPGDHNFRTSVKIISSFKSYKAAVETFSISDWKVYNFKYAVILY